MLFIQIKQVRFGFDLPQPPKFKHAGYTLIELMVSIAIIGFLAAVSIPTYISYSNKARFTEAIRTASSLKSSIQACAQVTGSLNNCSAGSNGITTPQPTQNMTGLTIAAGVITATITVSGASYTYILTPTYTAGVTTWRVSGTCVAAGLCS